MSEKKKPVVRDKCGTVAGYQAHVRAGESACAACKRARREYSAAHRKGEVAKRPPSKAERRRKAESVGEQVANAVAESTQHSPVGGHYPAFLQAAGRRLWDAVTAELDLSPSAKVILTEACRMTDRCEKMAAVLANKRTFWFEVDGLDAVEDGVQVVVNSMISESRQLTSAIRQALASIGALKPAEPKPAESVLDQLRKKREARQRRDLEQRKQADK